MESKLRLLVHTKFDMVSPVYQKEIYQEFYRTFYRTVLYMVNDHALTEDILQDSFLKVVQHLPSIDDESRLWAWVRVVVKNMTYNYLRKAKIRRNEVDAESVYISDSAAHATEIRSTEQQIELKALAEAVEECLTRLKPEYRVLIELRWKRELSYKEIAAELEITEEVVKYKLYRAREAVKKRLKPEWGEENDERRSI
ncbi:RNA polymerase sigma factor [Gorillibacterium timonense]|uniref:RNA polymerase sigma factor n=1 Tax=Gorillibacterium timonense TaxID=1689269 RepID=UPI00071D58B6|nr:sigma-70 family RNA polymerase sigma factor [Gorillibacterium timonense]